MLFHIRTNLDLIYRLLFVGLFLLFGLISLGIVLLEDYAGISVIPLESALEKQALLSVLSVMGILGICAALLVLYFMREKRRIERREKSVAINYPERRSIDDRRNSSN